MSVAVTNKRTINESNGGQANESNGLLPTSKEARKFRGVFPAGRRFRAVMQLDGVRHNLGMHSTEIEAARAYDKFAKEHYKKTNFPYPPKQEPIVSSTTALRSQFPSVKETSQSDLLSHSHLNKIGRSNLHPYSWPDNATTTAATSDISQSQPFGANAQSPLADESYGNGYNNVGYLGDPYRTQFNGSHTSHQPLYQDWQQPYWHQGPPLPPQHQHMYHPRLHDPYLQQSQMVHQAHPVVYVPVPLPIAEVITKYVHDFYLAEQQKHQQQLPPTVHGPSMFMQPSTPFPELAGSTLAPASNSVGMSADGQPVVSAPLAPIPSASESAADGLLRTNGNATAPPAPLVFGAEEADQGSDSNEDSQDGASASDQDDDEEDEEEEEEDDGDEAENEEEQ